MAIETAAKSAKSTPKKASPRFGPPPKRTAKPKPPKAEAKRPGVHQQAQIGLEETVVTDPDLLGDLEQLMEFLPIMGKAQKIRRAIKDRFGRDENIGKTFRVGRFSIPVRKTEGGQHVEFDRSASVRVSIKPDKDGIDSAASGRRERVIAEFPAANGAGAE